MKKHLIIFILIFLQFIGVAQTNIVQVGQLTYESKLSDVWGYEDTTGVEYALVGVNSGGTSVVSLANPAEPEEVYFAPGPNTIWRDIKTWNKHSYTVNDRGGEGLQILDLSSLPDTSGITVHQYLSNWTFAHNIYIDENGFAYIFGANRGKGGVIILDLSDPKNPVEVSVFDDFYVHDGFVRGDTMYLAHVLEGFFSIVDISDKQDPQLLATYNTPRNFTHNVWLSDNANYLYTTDERSGAWLAAYDISDLNNIFETDRTRSLHSGGNPVIVHNTHFLDNYLITSYYKDGVTIHDVSRPNNIIETGHFDTSPLSGAGYNGCWGVYPFLASSLILATDIEEGLFVLQPNYVRGAYLEGVITDEETLAPIKDVTVSFDVNTKEEFSNLDGTYATGKEQSGNYLVTFSKPGYYTKKIQTNLTQGDVTTLPVSLLKDIRFSLNGTVKSVNESNIPGVAVHIKTNGVDTIVLTNSEGEFGIDNTFPGVYEIQVQHWGILNACYTNSFSISNSPLVNLIATQGYQDNFSSDLGWEVSATAARGFWQRDKPIAAEPGEPMTDSDDCFNAAYFTKTDDVDNGSTVLTSPLFNGALFQNPIIEYQFYWHNSGLLANDFAEIAITNGNERIVIQEISNLNTVNDTWIKSSIRLSAFISLSNQMQLEVLVNDDGGLINHAVEVAFDDLIIREDPSTQISNLTLDKKSFVVYPNPIVDVININQEWNSENYALYNLQGATVLAGQITNGKILVTGLASGTYMLKVAGQGRLIIVE
jgi:choice-of-anchor B domain-containing protein